MPWGSPSSRAGGPHGGELWSQLMSSTKLPFMWRSHPENGPSIPRQASPADDMWGRGEPSLLSLDHIAKVCANKWLLLSHATEFWRGLLHSHRKCGVCGSLVFVLPESMCPSCGKVTLIFLGGTNPVPTLSTYTLNGVDSIPDSRDELMMQHDWPLRLLLEPDVWLRASEIQ